MASEKPHLVAVICGSGNGAHLMAAIAANQSDVEARILTLDDEKAQCWNESLPPDGITVQDVSGKNEKIFHGR